MQKTYPDDCGTCAYFRLAEDVRHGRLNADSVKFFGLENEENERLKEQLTKVSEELTVYKQKYADEVEKRLQLLEVMEG